MLDVQETTLSHWLYSVVSYFLRFVFQVTVTEEKGGEKMTKEKTVFDPYRLKICFDTRKFSAYQNGGMMTQVIALLFFLCFLSNRGLNLICGLFVVALFFTCFFLARPHTTFMGPPSPSPPPPTLL